MKCDVGCPRDICLDKYFTKNEWRKYEECGKWQLRYIKSIENKENRKNRAVGKRCLRYRLEFIRGFLIIKLEKTF